METLPCPEFFAGSNIFKVMWNFHNYLFPCLLCCNLVFQILWLSFVSSYKDEWTVLIVLFLQLWISICVFRYRAEIRLLTDNLYRISNMLRNYIIQKKKMLKIYIWVYCLYHPLISISYCITLLLANGFFALLPLYYCCVCICMNQFSFHFERESNVLIVHNDYQRILEIYKEMNETMIMMYNFLSLPIFISAVNISANLYWYGYSFAFSPNDNSVLGIFFSMGLVQYFVLLMMTLPPAATANQSAATAREIVLSLPGWFPQGCNIIKLLVCRSFMHKTALTWWKMYRIDNSLLISVIGTLISYGILFSTLGSVQSSNNDK
ncbi:uncharacterized protein CEXT_219711 [Caerostris extrusa]|uniref:Gustatory receptor n=1 Tax=Caerostris extrusa TaxID=172846 RepID=A0AAV4QRN2_CAEEX|nr:uncharacterized protein CEXT_219711 [Caerostris extrusa]